MWVGERRANGVIPAWSFVSKTEADIQSLKSILSKVIIETKTRQVASSQEKDESVDNNWLEAAVMAEDENQSQFSFGDYDKESAGSNIALEDVDMFDADEFDELEKLDQSEALIDEDLTPEIRNK